MSKKLTFKNSLGAEIEFTNTAPFLLIGLDPSNNVNIYNSKGVEQDGTTYLGNSLDIKDISLQVSIKATSEEILATYKNKINSVFNPKNGEGWLIYKDGSIERKIKCIVSKLPYFSPIIYGKRYDCVISLTANNPYWFDLEELKEEIALWIGSFMFDSTNGLEITELGIEMGYREPSLIVNVFNEGDTECGMKVEFKALASVVNPSILNVNTQEYIKINKTMEAEEVITVTTGFGNKKVQSYLNGVTTNAFNYIDFQSTFLQLAPGDNLFRYNADTGIDNLECSIYYTPQYLGV